MITISYHLFEICPNRILIPSNSFCEHLLTTSLMARKARCVELCSSFQSCKVYLLVYMGASPLTGFFCSSHMVIINLTSIATVSIIKLAVPCLTRPFVNSPPCTLVSLTWNLHTHTENILLHIRIKRKELSIEFFRKSMRAINFDPFLTLLCFAKKEI